VRLYTCRRAGLADEAAFDGMPEAAGGEGGHGAARPDRVIHRYISNRGTCEKVAENDGTEVLFSPKRASPL
jgi:hypothetical protein